MGAALFPQSKTSEDGAASTANTNTDGTTGTYTTLATGTASGDKEVMYVSYMGDGTLTAGALRFFVHDGTTAVLIGEVTVPPWTPRTAMPAIQNWKGVFVYTVNGKPQPIPLPTTSHTLKVSTVVAETFRGIAHGREFA